jgi:hypothetical protein
MHIYRLIKGKTKMEDRCCYGGRLTQLEWKMIIAKIESEHPLFANVEDKGR